MDPRIRSSLYEGAHGSPLYTAPRKNINPSTSGDHIQEEIAEVTKWVNHHLASVGHTDQLITDLSIDVADGITLLQLVQALCKEDLPKHFPNPIMRVQKLENLQMCLRMLQEKGLSLKGIHADDIVGGNVKTILAVCHALRRFFSVTGSKSPKDSTLPHESRTSTIATPTTTTFGSSSETKTRGFSFSSLDREDMALLGWLGGIVHRDISSYSMLYDGKILCDFANEVKSGAVSELVIISGSAVERLKIAFTALENSLFVRPKDLDIARLSTGKEDGKLRHYLASCRSVFGQQLDMKKKTRNMGKKVGERGKEKARGGSYSMASSSNMSREQVFESLRDLKSTAATSLEQREKAKVEARSREGILQQRMNGGTNIESKEKDGAVCGAESLRKRHGSNDRNYTSWSTNRLSSSIEGIPSATRGNSPTPSGLSSNTVSTSRGKGAIHRSHDQLHESHDRLHGSHDQLHESRDRLRLSAYHSRPLSQIYAKGDQSYSHSTKEIRQSNKLPDHTLSPEDWELEGREPTATQMWLSQPDYSMSISPSSSLSPTHTVSSSLGRSHSTDRGLGPSSSAKVPTRQISTASSSDMAFSGRKSSFDSDHLKSASTSGSSYTLPRMKKRSSTPSPLPSPSSPIPPRPPSVPPPSTVTAGNQPTFVPPGGTRYSRKLPPYPLPSDNETLAAQIADVQDSIILLSNQLLYEKADVYTRLHRAVIRERKRRQATEKRLRDFEKLAQQLIHHYDNCFVQLAKEVGCLRQEVASGNVTDSVGDRNRFGTGIYLSREVDQLREQVAHLNSKQDIYLSQPSLTEGSQSQTTEALFIRKRANSVSSLNGPYMTGSVSSFKKLSKFFGEEPPRLESIKTFLEGLGYSHLYPTFSVHQISLAELYQMDVSHLEILGIPLGPRIRIMAELEQLEPQDTQPQQQQRDS